MFITVMRWDEIEPMPMQSVNGLKMVHNKLKIIIIHNALELIFYMDVWKVEKLVEKD